MTSSSSHHMPAAQARPNFLFLLCDELRWDALGCMGHPMVATPNIDRLAARGVVFDRAYCTAPSCIPARSQMLTGLATPQCGSWSLSETIPPGMPTFAEALSGAGYATAAVGKMHFANLAGTSDMRTPHGFQHLVLGEEGQNRGYHEQDDYIQYLKQHGYADWIPHQHGRRWRDEFHLAFKPQTSPLPLEHFDTTWTGRETISMLERIAGSSSPFFLWSSFLKPHFPCELPADWPNPYRPEDVPLRLTTDYHPDPEREAFTALAALQAASKEHGWLEEETLRGFAAAYFANITLVDQEVGKILDALEQLGLTDNTMIVFSSDHGEHLGERGALGKITYYEESCRVPLIVAGPGVAEPGTRREELVILEDLCPTFVDAAGTQMPVPVYGRSLLPLLGGADPTPPWRDAVCGVLGGITQVDLSMMHAFVRRDRFKLMWQFQGGKQKLFDLEADPLEQHDLAAQGKYEDILRQLRGVLASWLGETGAGHLVRDGAPRTW